jgi:hypothetical protein
VRHRQGAPVLPRGLGRACQRGSRGRGSGCTSRAPRQDMENYTGGFNHIADAYRLATGMVGQWNDLEVVARQYLVRSAGQRRRGTALRLPRQTHGYIAVKNEQTPGDGDPSGTPASPLVATMTGTPTSASTAAPPGTRHALSETLASEQALGPKRSDREQAGRSRVGTAACASARQPLASGSAAEGDSDTSSRFAGDRGAAVSSAMPCRRGSLASELRRSCRRSNPQLRSASGRTPATPGGCSSLTTAEISVALSPIRQCGASMRSLMERQVGVMRSVPSSSPHPTTSSDLAAERHVAAVAAIQACASGRLRRRTRVVTLSPIDRPGALRG